MKRFNGREMQVFLILSIVVPVGLLSTSRLTGILQGPVTVSETMELNPVVWKCERPNLGSPIPNNFAKASYSSGEVSFTEILGLGMYDISGWLGSGPKTFLGITNFTVSVQSGFVHGIELVFREKYPSSYVGLFTERGVDGIYGGITLDKPVDVGYLKTQNLLEDDTKALLSFAAVDSPNQVSIVYGPSMIWYFHSQYNQTHQMEIDTRITYFNGTVYKEVVQPFNLIIGPDGNNSFENAEEIAFGEHKAYIDDGADPVDYYKIWLQQGQRVRIAIGLSEANNIPPLGQGMEIRVYNPNRQIVLSTPYGKDYFNENATTPQVTVNVDFTGWWHIQVDTGVAPTIYILTISEQT